MDTYAGFWGLVFRFGSGMLVERCIVVAVGPGGVFSYGSARSITVYGQVWGVGGPGYFFVLCTGCVFFCSVSVVLGFCVLYFI